MKNQTLGVIFFPVIAISVVTLLVNGFGVLIAGGLEREPTVTNRVIGLLAGLITMSCLYAIPTFTKWIPNKKNLGSSIWPVFVTIILTTVVGASMYLFVVNDTFQWTTSPSWLDGKQVVRGMIFFVLVSRWFMKGESI